MVTSSCESESHSIFETCKAGVYIKRWIEIFAKCPEPTLVFNDNSSAVSLLSSRTNSNLSKHFDVKLRYVTQLIEQNEINVYHIPREMNGADILTHSLSRSVFEALLVLIYGVDGVRGLLEQADRTLRSGGDLNWRSLATRLHMRNGSLGPVASQHEGR